MRIVSLPRLFVKKGENEECKLSLDTGKVSTDRLTKGASMSRKVKRSFLQNGITRLPVILERSEESGKGYKI